MKGGTVNYIKLLKENPEFSFGYRDIGNEGAKAIAKALTPTESYTPTLTTLYIADNNIGVEGAEAIATALKDNTTLTTLDISWNNIGVAGAQAIATALKDNSTLITLDIRGNNIGNEGAKAIEEALKDNTTLTKLDIDNNQINKAFTDILAKALQLNRHLFLDQYIKTPKSLNVYEPLMDCNKIDKSTIMYIICKLKKLFPNKDNSEFLKKEFIEQYVATNLLIKNEQTQKKLNALKVKNTEHQNNTTNMKYTLNTVNGIQYKHIIKPEYYPWRI